MSKIIVMDFDETYTVNKPMWNQVIALLRKHGMEVVCCTMRVGNPYMDRDVIEDMAAIQVPIIFAAHYHDKWDAMEKNGYIPENCIWIDDMPMFVWCNRDLSTLP